MNDYQILQDIGRSKSAMVYKVLSNILMISLQFFINLYYVFHFLIKCKN